MLGRTVELHIEDGLLAGLQVIIVGLQHGLPVNLLPHRSGVKQRLLVLTTPTEPTVVQARHAISHSSIRSHRIRNDNPTHHNHAILHSASAAPDIDATSFLSRRCSRGILCSGRIRLGRECQHVSLQQHIKLFELSVMLL